MPQVASPLRTTTPRIRLPEVARHVGDTPLLRLERVTAHLPGTVEVYAKAEHLNPGGSVKDRPALNMLLTGLRRGALEGRRLIDATSGNTGIAYAMLGGAFDVPVTLALPANASEERKRILRAHGVELILTDPMEGTDGAQREVRALVEAEPGRWFYPDQYNNDANWRAHYHGTGAEIIEQTGGRVTHFVTGLGTTGTFTGVTRRLKAHAASIRAVAVQPDGPLHGMEGLKHLPTAITPGIWDAGLPDEEMSVSTEEAYEMTRRLAREEGLLVGVSAGANVASALRVAERLEQGTVVTILCDTGTRYLSDDFWNG